MAKNTPQKRQTNHQVVAATQTVTHYQGAVPHPEILRGIDEVVPGAAARLITLAEQESNHRRSLEVKAIEANIAAQVAQAQINEQQTKSCISKRYDRSDCRIFGLFVLYRSGNLSWA